MTSSPEVQAAVGDPARFGDLQKGGGAYCQTQERPTSLANGLPAGQRSNWSRRNRVSLSTGDGHRKIRSAGMPGTR